MVAIAMTREMGTLGKDVAQGIADSLGLKIIHSELIEHDLATRLGVQESAVHRYLEGGASVLERWKIDKEKLSRYTAEELLEFAREGNVIIRGWGAVAVLRAVPHVLRVRVCAPMPFRERVIMERLELKDASEARSEIEQSDAAHARIMRGFFRVNWEDPQLYHVVLNTGSVPIDTCVRIVRLLTDDPAFQESEASRAILADKLIQTRARTVLGAFTSERTIGTGLDVAVNAGKVTLSGVIGQGVDLANAVDKIRQIDGVKDVESNVQRAPIGSGIWACSTIEMHLGIEKMIVEWPAAGIVDVRRILRERVSLNLTGRTGSHILITSPGGPVGSSDPALKWPVSAA